MKTLWLYVVLVKSCCCLLRLHLEDLLSRASNFSQTHSICSTHSEERTQKVKTWCQKLHINWVLAKEEIVQDISSLKIITYSWFLLMKPNYTSFSLSSISILRIWFHSSKEQGCLFLTRNNVLRNRKIAKAIRLASSFQLFRLRHQTKELATKKSGKGGISTFNGHQTSKKCSTYIYCIGLFQHQLDSWKILKICEKDGKKKYQI